jgi:hypothetical protein
MKLGAVIAALLLAGAPVVSLSNHANADDAPSGWVVYPQVVDKVGRPLRCAAQPKDQWAAFTRVDELGRELPVDSEGRELSCVDGEGHGVTCRKSGARYECATIQFTDPFDDPRSAPLAGQKPTAAPFANHKPSSPEEIAADRQKAMLECDKSPTWLGVLFCRWDNR